MTSGNFLIGQGLSLKGFKELLEPQLEKEGYSVSNKVEVYDDRNEMLLISVTGKENLENMLNDLLKNAYENLTKIEIKKGLKGPVYGHQLRNCIVIGEYDGDDTASELFSVIAQEYLAKKAQKEVRELSEKVRSLMDKRLSEL